MSKNTKNKEKLKGCKITKPKPNKKEPNLTKQHIVANLSNKTGIPRSQIKKLVQDTLDLISTAVANKQEVHLCNFGSFTLRLTKSRIGRNPNRPEMTYVIPSRAVVKFHPSKNLNKAVGKTNFQKTQELVKN